VGTWTFCFVDMDLFLVLVEVVVPKGFALFPGVVVLKGFVAIGGFVVLTGLIGTGVFLLACPLPFARFAHVLPQYGYTMVPLLYLGFLLQCLRGQIVQQFPHHVRNHTLTLHNERVEAEFALTLTFMPVPLLGPLTIF